MPRFSRQSKANLATCHPDIQFLFNRVIQIYDCSILDGHRGRERQERYFRDGKSKVHWPDSKHNNLPSLAVDACPYPEKWDLEDPEILKQWYYFGGLVLGMAKAYNIPLRWGGDWDRDGEFTDQKFHDLGHFELVG
jgi:peptidoglycan L-alanyl-D-glutamate endopeptidase CwlK